MRKVAVILLITLLNFFALLHSTDPLSARPVVVIPGIEGSQLCSSSGEILWGDRDSYRASRLAALRIPFGTDGKDSGVRSCGLITTVNIIPLFYQSDVYSPLLKILHDLGYAERDIIIFDYDWRLTNFENAARLRDTINHRLPDPNAQVDIVAHSMGGIIARIYIQMLGGENRAQNVIFLGTPHLGSAKVFKELKNGFDNWPNALSGGLAEIQRTILSFPSTYQLLPTYDQCCAFSETVDPVRATYVDLLTPSVWQKFNWLPDDFKSGKGYDFLSTSLAEAKRLKILLAAPIFQAAPNLSKLHFIANGFIDTWSRVFFHPSSGNIVGSTSSPGDGTVLLFSATNGVASQFQLSPLDHEHIFAGKEAELVLNAALTGNTFHAGTTGFSQQIRDDKNHEVTVADAQFEVDRRVVTPGSTLNVMLTLKGPQPLKIASLSGLYAELRQGDATVQKIPLKESTQTNDDRSFQQPFTAPTEPGAYKLRLHAPDLEPIETIFAVMVP